MFLGIYDLFDELKKRNAFLVTAESLTGGLIAERITDIPGASSVFWGGWVTYTEQAKQHLLSVPNEVIRQFGVVSVETASAMAQGALNHAAAVLDRPCYALAVTGLAGPKGAEDQVPVGTVCIACTGNEKELSVRYEKYLFCGTRSEIREQTYTAAMQMLMQQLDKIKNKEIQ